MKTFLVILNKNIYHKKHYQFPLMKLFHLCIALLFVYIAKTMIKTKLHKKSKNKYK